MSVKANLSSAYKMIDRHEKSLDILDKTFYFVEKFINVK